MAWFQNLNIAKKLLSGFILVAVIAGIVGVCGVYNLYRITAEDKDLYERFTVPLSDVIDMLESYYIERVEARNMLLAKDPAVRDQAAAKVKSEMQRFRKSIDDYEKTVASEAGRKNVAALKAIASEYDPYLDKLIGLAQAGQSDAAMELMRTEGVRQGKIIEAAMQEAETLKRTMAGEKAAANQTTANNAVILVAVLVTAAVILAVALGFIIARIVSNPINQLVAAANKLAEGDVNVNIASATRDEIGLLMAAFGKMIENIRQQAQVVERIAAGDLTVAVPVRSDRDLLGKRLSEMVETNNRVLGNINIAAEQVAAGAEQIAASGEALSQGSTEQASAIEEITSSMTQVAVQTKQNAVNADQANTLAQSAREQAVAGNGQMSEMVRAMAEINDSSVNISKIIKVIDEIAFQTNILALNAAVEAARAGQHGKGFAVVAEEVRNLAARSANAAKETTGMIESSIKKVEIGTKFASETASALHGIVEEVGKVTSLVGDIAAASNEQANAIAQINQAINQVSQVVQTNSATAEESASASEELSSQAETMKANVRRFKLKQTALETAGSNGVQLNPELLRLLETVSRQNQALPSVKPEAAGSQPLRQAKIVLDDAEFGKY